MVEEKPDMLAHALDYVRQGFGVIPSYSPLMFHPGGRVTRRGRPLTSTGKVALRYRLQRRPLRTEAAVRYWFTRYPDANIKLALGRRFGLAVLDIDDAQAAGLLPGLAGVETRRALTGDGEHRYFAWNGPQRLNTVNNGLGKGLTLMADGRVAVAVPPSMHASGRRYRWVDETVALAPLPPGIVEAARDFPRESMLAQAVQYHFRKRYLVFPVIKLLYLLPWGGMDKDLPAC